MVLSSSYLVHGAPQRVVRRANQTNESLSFIMDQREGFNYRWIEAKLVKIESDHINPVGAWGSSGSLPAERARVKVQDSPRRMMRWHAKHMTIWEDLAAGSQRGGWGLSGKGPHRFVGDEVTPVNDGSMECSFFFWHDHETLVSHTFWYGITKKFLYPNAFF